MMVLSAAEQAAASSNRGPVSGSFACSAVGQPIREGIPVAEDGEYQAPGERIEEQLMAAAGRLNAGLAEAMRPERNEYALVRWEQVNALGRDGWRLIAVHSRLTKFVMVRPLGAADEAAELLERHQSIFAHAPG